MLLVVFECLGKSRLLEARKGRGNETGPEPMGVENCRTCETVASGKMLHMRRCSVQLF